MGADSMPIVSQLKSLVQVTFGDAEGARQTQENFVRECPVISQITSVVQAIGGDEEAALLTQLQFVDGLSRTVDGIPIVGHIKGALHYVAGDSEGGDNAMKSASRTVGAVGGGAVGFLAGGGPVGAVAGGIAGGAFMDGITTGVESVINQEYCPSGYVDAVTRVMECPTPGEIFDLALMPIADALGGEAGGAIVTRLTEPGSVASGTSKMPRSVTKAVNIITTVATELLPDALELEEPETRYQLEIMT